jgi:putative ABC transport system permease protein
MGAYAPRNFALQGRTGSERVLGAAVSANYFQVIGVGPRWGRSFGPEEDQPGRDHVVIISEVLCRRLYGEQTEVLGRSVQLNSETYTIVGIAPAGFCFPNVDTEAWIPLAFSGNDLQARNNHWLNVIGRLSALRLDRRSARTDVFHCCGLGASIPKPANRTRYSRRVVA